MEQICYEELQLAATNKIGLQCPQCQSAKHIKYGNAKGKQRYQCKACSKTFYTDNGTPYYRLRKRSCTVEYLQAMSDGLSIRQSAKVAGISVKTSFLWRHRFLSSINNRKPIDSKEIICVKEVKMPYSDKGKRNITEERHSDSRTLLQISATGKISLLQLPEKQTLTQAIRMFTQTHTPTMYVSQASKFITLALRRSGNEEQICREPRLNEKYINQIAQINADVDQWMSRFRGVATKYLSQYWGWYCLAESHKNNPNEKNFSQQCASERKVGTIKKLKQSYSDYLSFS